MGEHTDTDTPATEDRYTAAPDAIPSRDPAREKRTLGECFRAFLRRPTPWMILATLLASIAWRASVGSWSWRDAFAVVAVFVSLPFVEWLIHVYILHSKPFSIGGRTFNLPSAAEHRAHHEVPTDLDVVFIPVYVLCLLVPTIVGIAAVESWLVHLVIGGSWLAIGSTALVASYVCLGLYEWSHFLIHSPYRPRSRYYKLIWKNHRLHHYKNEQYWFGVTSPVSDVALHTYPDQKSVPKSPTARALLGTADNTVKD